MSTESSATRRGAIQPKVLRVLLIPHGDAWSAQCLNYDLAAQGRTLPEAHENLACLVRDQIAVDKKFGRKPFEGIPPAPSSYWNAWEHAVRLERAAAHERSSQSAQRCPPPLRSEERVAVSAVA